MTGDAIGGAGGSGAVRRVAVHLQARTLLAGRGSRLRGIGSAGGDLTAVISSRRDGDIGLQPGDDRPIAAGLIGPLLVGEGGVAAGVRVRGFGLRAVEAVARDHRLPDHRIAAVLASCAGQLGIGDQPGFRLSAEVAAETVTPGGLRLAGVPRLGIDDRDHPVRRHPPRDAPPPVGAVGILGGLHVLAGNQRQQAQRVRRGLLALRRVRPGELGQHRQRLIDQIRHQTGLRLGIIPVDVGLARLRIVQPGHPLDH